MIAKYRTVMMRFNNEIILKQDSCEAFLIYKMSIWWEQKKNMFDIISELLFGPDIN